MEQAYLAMTAFKYAEDGLHWRAMTLQVHERRPSPWIGPPSHLAVVVPHLPLPADEMEQEAIAMTALEIEGKEVAEAEANEAMLLVVERVTKEDVSEENMMSADEMEQEAIAMTELEVEEEEELMEAEADEALSLDTERVTKEAAGEQIGIAFGACKIALLNTHHSLPSQISILRASSS